MKVFSLRLSDELAERVRVARGDVPQQVWIVRAVEQALGNTSADGLSGRTHDGADSVPPAPAEQLGSGGGPAGDSLEGQASDPAPLSRAEMFRRATQ